MNNNIIMKDSAILNTKDYKVEFIKKKRLFNSSQYKYNCYINFYSILGTKIKTISGTEQNMLILLDDIYQLIDNTCEDIIVTFPTNSDNCSVDLVKIESYIDNLCNKNFKFKVINYSNEIMNEVVSINMTNELYTFIHMIYYLFILDQDNEDYIGNEYSPDIFFSSPDTFSINY